MNNGNGKLLYALFFVVLGMIILLPTLFSVIPIPKGESFTELWLLQSHNQIETGKLSILQTRSYTVNLGVANHMGDPEYYRIYAKLRLPNEPLPNKTLELESPMEPLLEYRLFLRDNEIWNKEFSFSFGKISYEEKVASVSDLSLDVHTLKLNKIVPWDEARSGFYCQLFFELWVYNSTVSHFQYHNRYVSVWLQLVNE